MNSNSYSDMQTYIKYHKEVLNFFKAYSGLDEKLVFSKAFEVYTKALNVHNYRCIQTYKFLSPRIINNPFYSNIIGNSTEKKILDIGCALGTDLRKISLDGISQENLFGLDIEEDFVQLGYELFNDKSSNKITFLNGNILDESQIEILKLNEKFNIVYSGSVVHLLSKEDIKRLFSNIFKILGPGGIFFGQTTGLQSPKNITDSTGKIRFLHSKSSLENELKSHGFVKIQVIVDTNLSSPQTTNSHSNRDFLYFYTEKPI